MNFTESEIAELDAAVGRECPGQSFQNLVKGYETFVRQLKGYNFTIYDYDNDVSGREVLDLALQKCRPELRDKALASLKGLDEIFVAETVEVERKRGGTYPWSKRLPREPGPELREDIESGNY